MTDQSAEGPAQAGVAQAAQAPDARRTAGPAHVAGLFVTFEGGDGAGKTTQIQRVQQWFRTAGRQVLVTREPGGTELGAELRRLVQRGPEDVDPRTEALLYAADRAYHVATLVRPSLARGQVVLSDRYIDSSVAYQGAARQLGAAEILRLSQWATRDLRPDLTFLLDLPPEVGARRGTGDPDRLEREPGEFHERVRHEYLRLAHQDPARIVVIDAVGTPDQVFAEIRGVLEERFGGGGAALVEQGGAREVEGAREGQGDQGDSPSFPDGEAEERSESGPEATPDQREQQPAEFESQDALWGSPGEGMLL